MDEHRMRAAHRRAVLSWAEGARTWDPATLATPVPATPGWSVRDLLAHVTGATIDLVAGEMHGAPGPSWSARHLVAWSGRPAPEAAVALASAAAAVPDDVLASASPTPVWDLVVHRDDVREALGEPPVEAEWAPVLERAWAFVAAGGGCPTVRTGDGVWPGGAGEAELDADDHGLFRVLFSRRSRRQVAALVHGDVAAVEGVQLFGTRDDDQPSVR
ncbi:MAG: hypothetical protein Q7T56_02540 [Nocardioidaceae bacterium]|nr:hypothetical protein [Nocardioidaceae bacterium]